MDQVTDNASHGLVHADLTRKILSCVMRVHGHLGPGLLEHAYRACMSRQLTVEGLAHRAEVSLPIVYKGTRIEHGFRADIIVEDRVLLELKAVEQLLSIHEAQVLTYLKLSNIRVGLLINFNVVSMKHGFRRFVR